LTILNQSSLSCFSFLGLANSMILFNKQSNVLFVMISLEMLDILVGNNILYRFFRFSFQYSHFTFCFILQGLDNLLSIETGTQNFWFERFRNWDQSFLEKSLWFVKIRIELREILNIRSNETGRRVSLQYFLLTIEISMLWIGKSKMIVLNWSSKQNMRFLNIKYDTVLENSAVSSMSYVLEVTD